MIFYLGTNEPAWLPRVRDVPLFVSRRRLARRKALPRAATSWALDSGGFTELSLHGAWQTTARQYVDDVRRYVDEIGRLVWASPQDWMCEPHVIARTGLDVAQHQRRTVDNYRELRDLAPELPFVPVLQGWTLDDYQRCADLYAQAGVDLGDAHTVGVGSVCRRQGEASIAEIMRVLSARGFRLHGFGVKARGLRASSSLLASADSMAWSFRARQDARIGVGAPGCSHATCSSCMTYALQWRARLLSQIGSAA